MEILKNLEGDAIWLKSTLTKMQTEISNLKKVP